MNAPLPDAVRRALAEVTLDDKWILDRGRAYMSGTQALIRLAMLQHQRDRLDGLNTAGFITGYRGSPLGGVDQTAWKAADHLVRHNVRFQPGLNEDLAATSVWGTQQVNLFEGAKYDGVYAMWYGKGPGVDRCGDVFKHANAAGTSRHGGVLALAGDDHGAKSSTLPHQSDHIFKACMMPVLYPATVQEYLDLGLHGFAMSRFAGVWVGMKTVTEVVEASASVIVDPERVELKLPADFVMPQGGLNIRWPDSPLDMEARLLDYKLYAALAYCRTNRLNYTVIDSPHARFGIVATGKAYLDTRQALADLGLDERTCQDLGIRLFKCGMIWPLEATSIRAFAEGLEEILVVEEKRQFVEYQLKEELFSWIGTGKRIPRVIGKFDEKDGGEWAVPQGNWILPAHYEFSPATVAKAIVARIGKLELPAEVRARMQARLAIIEAKERALAKPRVVAERKPWFCSGCPHNTSTNVPEGSRAVAGIGCHYMVVWMDRNTSTYTQMGGEGVPWIGQAPFTNEKHIFANLGDGTYFHSGSLAVRAAVAANVPITYKILFNDAVAMTGGQPTDGQITPPQITQQMYAEGVRRIVIVTDDPDKYDATHRLDQSGVNAHGATGDAWNLAPGVSVHHRDELERIQLELREYSGVSVLLYDQTCASEKRRRRKKNTAEKIAFPDPAKRVVINELVCEGCGDCSVQSNCLSVEPLETEFGRKRQINQSTCNKDYSCLKGFCPSFVTVEGGRLRKGKPTANAELPSLPEPERVALPARGAYGIVVTGVGGTGVVTIGQLLGMAAHLEGRGVSVLDMAGLAQKGGAVYSHVQIAPTPADLYATRIAMGDADLVLGCDLIVTTSNEAMAKIQPGKTKAVVNTAESPTAEFVSNPDWQFGGGNLTQQVREAVHNDAAFSPVDASAMATALLGDGIYTNPFMLGYAWQRGWIPLSLDAMTRAIELNGVAVAANLKAFGWGRFAAHDGEAARRAAFPESAAGNVVELKRFASSLEDIVARRVEFLTEYQSARYARRYSDLVQRVQRVESDRLQSSRISEAVARSYFKLLAYKDEYEVARLHSDPAFRARIASQFEGDYRLAFHLAPPLLSKTDPQTGRAKKKRYGPWMMTAFSLLAPLKFLRGSPFDVFGYSEERRTERALVGEYETLVDEILARLGADNAEAALQLARLPEDIRGYGPVKAANLQAVRARQETLLARLRGQVPAQVIRLPQRAA